MGLRRSSSHLMVRLSDCCVLIPNPMRSCCATRPPHRANPCWGSCGQLKMRRINWGPAIAHHYLLELSERREANIVAVSDSARRYTLGVSWCQLLIKRVSGHVDWDGFHLSDSGVNRDLR